MKTVIVYESIYGNTHEIADAIGKGVATVSDVTVVSVEQATTELLEGADLIVMGGPTQAHGMSRASSREAAVDPPHSPKESIVLDGHAKGPGVRDLLDSFGHFDTYSAAFDTRFRLPVFITGRASRGIQAKLSRHGCTAAAQPESFFVTRKVHLRDGEDARAEAWGCRLAASVAGRVAHKTPS